MEGVFIHGLMVESMMESIIMIKNMVLVFIHGQMDVVMKAIGKMGNNMV